MFTSVIEENRKKAAKTAFTYLLMSLFCVLFGAVYEVHSHEVYSFYMIYAFVFPLAGGVLPFLILTVTRAKIYPTSLSCNLYHSGIATLTVGSIVRGVLDIYGTSNTLSEYYWSVGGGFFVAGILVYTASVMIGRKNEHNICDAGN